MLARSIWGADQDGERKKLYRAGDKLHLHEVDELVARGIKEVEVVDFKHEDSLHFDMILNCLEREDIKLVKEDPTQDEPTKADALSAVYATLMPGEPITVENAERDLHSHVLHQPPLRPGQGRPLQAQQEIRLQDSR